jgi:hypothetical protein
VGLERRRVKAVKIFFVYSKKGPDSEARAEDTQQAEFESNSNQNSEHRESSKVDGVDWSGLQMLGMQFSETVGKHYQNFGVDNFVKSDSKVYKETDPENFSKNPAEEWQKLGRNAREDLLKFGESTGEAVKDTKTGVQSNLERMRVAVSAFDSIDWNPNSAVQENIDKFARVASTNLKKVDDALKTGADNTQTAQADQGPAPTEDTESQTPTEATESQTPTADNGFQAPEESEPTDA